MEKIKVVNLKISKVKKIALKSVIFLPRFIIGLVAFFFMLEFGIVYLVWIGLEKKVQKLSLPVLKKILNFMNWVESKNKVTKIITFGATSPIIIILILLSLPILVNLLIGGVFIYISLWIFDVDLYKD